MVIFYVPAALPPGRNSGTPLNWSRIGSRFGLDSLEKEFSYPFRESIHGSSVVQGRRLVKPAIQSSYVFDCLQSSFWRRFTWFLDFTNTFVLQKQHGVFENGTVFHPQARKGCAGTYKVVFDRNCAWDINSFYEYLGQETDKKFFLSNATQ